MAISDKNIYRAYPSIFDAVTINNISDLQFTTDVKNMIRRAAGANSPGFVAEVARDPRISLRTGDLATVLTSLSPTSANRGLVVSTLHKIQYQRRGGTGSQHVTLTGPAGFLYCTDFGTEQDAQAPVEANLTYIPLGDASNPPITVNVSQAITGSPSIGNQYKLGPVTIEGTQLKTVSRVRVNTGIGVSTNRSDGMTYADYVKCSGDAFTAEIVCKQIEVGSTFAAGTFKITAGSNLYFRRMKQGSDQYADNENQHILVQFLEGAYTFETIGAAGTDDADCRITITGTVSDTHDVATTSKFSIATGQQISV